MRFNPVLGASDNFSSCGGVDNRNEETDGLSDDVLGGTSDKVVVAQRSLPSCDNFGDGYSLRVHNEEERVYKEGRAARARACEASRKAAWSSELSPRSTSRMEVGINKFSSEETPSIE